MNRTAGRRISGVLIGFLAVVVTTSLVQAQAPQEEAEDPLASWQKGMTIKSWSPDEFASPGFRAAVDAIAENNASHVTLDIPLEQDGLDATEVVPAAGTPTDGALIEGINYIHSKGMAVMLKPSLRANGHWQAYVDPVDREAWFESFGARILHMARLGEEHGVEVISVGAEIIRMSSHEWNSTNTENWRDLIADVREVYSGLLTYSAHWDPDDWYNEKEHIQFWDDLDFIGIAAFFDFKTHSDSVSDFLWSWEYWREHHVEPLHERWDKPIVFTEIGYRSVNGTRLWPWDWNVDADYDPQEQANLYEALFTYWSQFDWFGGVHLWQWQDSAAEGNIEFSPQHKLAQQVMATWFGGEGEPSASPSGPEAARIVYDDELYWDDWSWSTVLDFEASDQVFEGEQAMAVTFERAWAGLIFNVGSLPTDSFSHLEFMLHPNGEDTPFIAAGVRDIEGDERETVDIDSYAEEAGNGWFLVSIPLEDMDAEDLEVGQLVLQEDAGTTHPTFFLDDIRFTANPGLQASDTTTSTAAFRGCDGFPRPINFLMCAFFSFGGSI